MRLLKLMISVWEKILSDLFSNIIKIFFTIMKKGRKILRDFSTKYSNIAQIIQITFIYFFAVVDLFHSILNNIFSLGYFPEILKPVFPLVQAILVSPILRFWSSPEKIFFLSYLAIEFMVVRSIFKFSKLVRYNILLVFSLLMVQGLAISYWDLLFHRQIATSVAKWTYDQGMFIHTDKTLAVVFFFITFMLFMVVYFYLYLCALSGKFTTFYGINWITDSVAFWLRIKTPNLRFGKRKKK